MSKSKQSNKRTGALPAPAAQSTVDRIGMAGVVAFAGLISLFAVRNNDIWWLLAVARRMLETRVFITEDPFTFTVAGTPWAPQWYLAAFLFYAVYAAASAWGLIVLRSLLVMAMVAVTFRSLREAGARWILAAPVVLVALLNAHSRFLVRAHLFEYLFLTILVWFLLTAGRRGGRSFFVIPVALQLLWVNTHPSFALGPALASLFFLSEKLALWGSGRFGFVRPYYPKGYNWRRVGLLVVLMALVCLVNPAPHLFLTQPFGTEQRELMTRFTLEWRSPFDPALRHGPFHPWYEILLGLAALSLVLSLARLPLAPAALIVATAVLSFQAHRFRVEFALVAVPMIFVLLRASPVVAGIGRKLNQRARGPALVTVAAAALTAALAGAGAGRVEVGEAVADRYPEKAFRWIRDNNVAHRPFHTIGHGSYLLWSLYGERRSFIDGRNFSPALYRDFLACQVNDRGRREVAAKYELDAFVLPAIEQSDAGIERVHRSLVRDGQWTLCYTDRHAWIYVRDAAVDPAWLGKTGFGAYHPLTLHNRKMSDSEVTAVVRDLERAVAVSPDYVRTRIDLAMVYLTLGRASEAIHQIDRALEIDPHNKTALELRGRLRTPGRR